MILEKPDWTSDTVQEIATLSLSLHDRQNIADAHNAALAAALDDAKKTLLLLTERSLQLVAEKEISATLAEQVHTAQQQLARRAGSRDVTDEAIQDHRC